LHVSEPQIAVTVWYSGYPISIQKEALMKTKLIVSAILLASLLSACEKDQAGKLLLFLPRLKLRSHPVLISIPKLA